jgi:hypothetical protein
MVQQHGDGDRKLALTVIMTPHVSGAKVRFYILAGGATFEGGESTVDLDSDELPDGPYTYFLYAPLEESATCSGVTIIP